MAGIDFERLERETSVRLSVPDPYRPFAEGGFPTPSGKCELVSDKLAAEGLDPLAGYTPPREGPTSSPELAKRYPLAFISPPAHHFLNSTFSAQPVFVRREGEPSLTIHPDDAARRGIADGQMVRTFNDRGSFLAKAHVSDTARPGVVVGLSIWWAKMCPGGRNANAVTGQELSDMGRGATFYDVLVEVAPRLMPAGFDGTRCPAGRLGWPWCWSVLSWPARIDQPGRSLSGVRDSRLLLLAAMFACQSQALAREWYDVWRDMLPGGRVRGRDGAGAARLSPRPAQPPSSCRGAAPRQAPAAGDTRRA